MTALATALRQAGVRSLDDRLADLLLRALIENPGSMAQAVDAALVHIETREPELAWPLHGGPHHRRAVSARMEVIRTEMAEAERQRRKVEAGCGGGQSEGADQNGDAAPTSGAGQIYADDQVSPARPAPPSGAEARRAQAVAAARGLLATIVVNGKPLAEALPEEARAAGRAKLHAAKGGVAEGRFLLRIAENLPPNDPIGRWRSAEDAETAMAAAKAWASERISHAED